MNTRPKQTYFDRRPPASYNTIVKQESWGRAKSLAGSAETPINHLSHVIMANVCTANRSTGVVNAQSIEQLMKGKDS